MFVTRIRGRRRSTLHRLARLHAGIGWNDGGTGGGGAADDKAAHKKDDAAKDKGADKAAADTVTMSKSDLDAKIAAALAEQQRKADAKAAKEKADAEAEEAKKRGEFEKVATAEKERADKAEREARELRRSIALRDHLTEKHPDYAACSKYILPLIPAEIDGDELPKAIEKAASEYVKDNPRQVKGGAGLNPEPRTANRQQKQGDGSERKIPNALPNGNRIVSASSRF